MESFNVAVPGSLPTMVIVFFGVAFLFRVATLGVSIRHEKVLKRNGAIEYGAFNSSILALCHVVFYACALGEGFYKDAAVDSITIAGMMLYLFSAAVLLLVIRVLGDIWTVKLMISPQHVLVSHSLFRFVRHPNYFLNIIPELVGLALVFHSFLTLFVGLALYLIPLSVRIKEEETVMREKFATNIA